MSEATYAFLNIQNIRYEPAGALIFADTDKGTMRLCDMRGWGHLVGGGAWNLDFKEAEAIQDSLGEALAQALSNHLAKGGQQ
jgi:hypothetical protein